MASKKKTKPDGTMVQHFRTLRGYMKRVAKGSVVRNRIYSLCIKASVVRCYEFNVGLPRVARARGAFFSMAALRGLCEDLIVLRFVRQLPAAARKDLLFALSAYETRTRIKLQGQFFSFFRPQQPVLRLADVDTQIAASAAIARTVWNAHGWPRLNKGSMPPIREIAEKQGLHQLTILYDYMYRLTSACVHFSVQSLLRSGWGTTPREFAFSSKNFHRYFEAYCSLYGAFLFCLYFEFFGSVLTPGKKEREAISEIRKAILFTRRWPEMVTFEEMNLKEPDDGETFRMLVSAMQAVGRPRLMSRGVNYGNRRSAESRLVRQTLALLAKADADLKAGKAGSKSSE